MKNNTYIVQVKETYTVSVAVQAEDEDAAYDKVEGLVNDDVIDPVALTLADRLDRERAGGGAAAESEPPDAESAFSLASGGFMQV